MITLPVDLITVIFLLLPAKTLLRFKAVCKLWYNLINDVHFINRHLELSISTKTNLHFVITTPLLHLVDFDTFENPVALDYPFKNPDHGGVSVVGSCNGLLCLRVYDYDFKCLLIYNPTTRTHRLTPYLPIPEPLSYPRGSFNFGFGFDTVSQDYKCVRIGQSFDKETGSSYCEVMVYSLRNDVWRRGPNVPYYFYIHRGSCTLLHETLHWIGDGGGDDRVPRPIVTFNLQDESFSSLSLPDFDMEWFSTANVGVLDECLCVLVSYLYESDVWIMKEYGVVGSWKKVFNVMKHDYIEDLERIISYSRNQKELFVRICLFQVAYLDLETRMTTDVQVANIRKCFDAYLCVENLIMLGNADYDSVEEEKEEQEQEQHSKKKGKKKGKKKRSKKRNARHQY